MSVAFCCGANLLCVILMPSPEKLWSSVLKQRHAAQHADYALWVFLNLK
jgi:hypothetical protein